MRFGLIITLTGLVLSAGAALRANQYYAAPNGKPSSDGSSGAPWDLQTALSKAAPGDTVWLRGGDYAGRFNCYASGTPDAPIVYRQYRGERAAIASSNTQLGAITLQCHDVWFWGFEIYSTSHRRVSTDRGSFPNDIDRGPAIEGAPDASRCKLINMVIHDDFNPFLGKQAADFEVYGSIFYYSGWDAPDRGHGHAIYAQNSAVSGTKRILDNIFFDSFAEGIHIYSQGDDMRNFDIEGNVVFNSGYPSAATGFTTNIIVGGGSYAPKNIVLNENYTYHSPAAATKKNHSEAVWLGSLLGCSDMVVTNNYFVNETGTAIHRMPACEPKLERNVVVGQLENLRSQDYPHNCFYPTAPQKTKVFVRPNRFELGRANIVVYNWTHKPAVDVDVSSVLRPGEKYQLRDAQDFFGAAILNGTYSGAPLVVPMTGTAVPVMIGEAPVIPQHTPREFGVFVLLPADSEFDTP